MRKQIEKKLMELNRQKEQAMANLNAVMGAIQVLQELLEDAEKEVMDKK